MKTLSAGLTALCLLLSPVAAADLNTQIDQTNFVVGAGCSGTLIDLEKKYVLTAHHCIEDLYKTVEKEVLDGDKIKSEKSRVYIPGTVSQQFYNGVDVVKTVTYTAKLEKIDKDNDLALMAIESDIPNTMAAPIACVEPKRADDIAIVGNPMGTLYSSVVKGIVSSVQRERRSLGVDDKPTMLVQVSGGIIGGNSGGAILNAKNELVGVSVMAHRTHEVIGFGVPLKAVRKFLTGTVSEKALSCG